MVLTNDHKIIDAMVERLSVLNICGGDSNMATDWGSVLSWSLVQQFASFPVEISQHVVF